VENLAYNENAHPHWVLPYYVEDHRLSDRDWVYSGRTGGRLFWLPDNRRPPNSECVDAHGDRLAIGSRYGVLTLLDMSRLQVSGNEPA
jgi:hypothetical protein